MIFSLRIELDWRSLVNHVFLIFRNKDDFFCQELVFEIFQFFDVFDIFFKFFSLIFSFKYKKIYIYFLYLF